jgi:hypothetical protein
MSHVLGASSNAYHACENADVGSWLNRNPARATIAPGNRGGPAVDLMVRDA